MDKPKTLVEQARESVYAETLENLQSLDRMMLRRVAWEALLMSDGPDHVEGSVDNAAVIVYVQRDAAGRDDFRVYCPTDTKQTGNLKPSVEDLRGPKVKKKKGEK